MKKFLFCLATMIASISMVSATNNYNESVAYGINQFAESVDGTYNGTAVATKMNGRDLPSPISVPGSFTISGGYLSGGFNAGPHSFYMEAVNEISAEGSFSVAVEGNVAGKSYTGTASGSITNGVLSFTCNAVLDSGAESVFEFTGN